MSVQTKKRFKNLGKIVGIILFVALMFTNIKVALMDDAELASGAISVLGIELNLFVPTYAEGGYYIDCYWDYMRQTCTVFGDGPYCVGTYGLPAEVICHYDYN